MQKVDLKKDLKHLYGASSQRVVEVQVPPMTFLMVDGQGDLNTSQTYADAVEALFSVSYTAKFAVKRGPLALDYGVMPLEGLWWADDLTSFSSEKKAQWKWTMMIMQPVFVPNDVLLDALASVKKKEPALSSLDALRLAPFDEGRCAQTLHVGPFSEEGPTVERVHQFIAERGQLRGTHHEIYLSDVRRADPCHWKTVIRQPMR